MWRPSDAGYVHASGGSAEPGGNPPRERAWDMFGYRGEWRRAYAAGARCAVAVTVMAFTMIAASATSASAADGAIDKITGSVTIEHVSGRDPSKVSTADVSFEAFEETAKRDAEGSFQLTVYGMSGEIGRQITVRVIDTEVEQVGETGYGSFLGVVTADERRGGAAGHGSGSDGHTDGHDDGHTDSHDDGTHGGPGDHATGRDRVGQLIVVRVVDDGSPGRFDELAWKWFPAGSVTLADAPDLQALCWKSILSGNLQVHTAKVEGDAPKGKASPK